MSEQPEAYDAGKPLSMDNAPARAQHAFAMEFRNAFGAQRLVVIASDIWEAMSRGDAYITEKFGSNYPYRLVSAKELDGAVLPAGDAIHEVGQ